MSSSASARRYARALGLIAMLACGSPAFPMEESGGGSVQPQTEAEQFCVNVADTARDARLAWEMQTLAELQTQLEEQTAALEAKRAELEEWVHRREEFASRAESVVVEIYAKMRADAAATQLAQLDRITAAAVLSKLDARVASAILNEMDTPQAVSLASLLAGNSGADGEDVQQQ